MKIVKLLIIFELITPCSLFAKSRDLYISMVEKDSVRTFISRFVSDKHQIVVSAKPIDLADKALKVIEQDNEQLFFVELDKSSAKVIDGEITRFGNIAIVKKLKSDLHDGHFHNLINPLEYWEAIPHQEMSVNAPAQPLQRADKMNSEFPKLEIDGTFLNNKLKELTGLAPVQIGDSSVSLGERYSKAGKKLTRRYLEQEFKALGYQVYEHNFGRFTSGVNFVAEKKGADKPYYILSSHYDTVRTVGADDDGSGLIAGLAIAKALAHTNHQFGIRFVAFDQEERGLIGSKAYAAYLQEQGELDDMLGLIQLEMLGWDADKDFKIHVIDCNENSSADLSAAFLDTVERLDQVLKNNEACTNRSDHASFWRYNKPAIVISQNFFGGDSNPCYHRSCDQFDKINQDYLHAITLATANTTARLINPLP